MRALDAIHQRLESCLEDGDDGTVYRALQEATTDIDRWLEEWDARMSRRFLLHWLRS